MKNYCPCHRSSLLATMLHYRQILEKHLAQLLEDRRCIIISIDGNIAVGKSTFLSGLKVLLQPYPNIHVMQEPIKEWRVGFNENEAVNLLDLYYDDPKGYGELFQMNAFASLLLNLVAVLQKNCDGVLIIITERSLFSSVRCFGEMLHKMGLISDSCIEILLSQLHALHLPYPDVIFYLREPDNMEELLSRIQRRGRKEEKKIDIDYLKELGNKYKEILVFPNNGDDSPYLINTDCTLVIPTTKTEGEDDITNIIADILITASCKE